MWRQLPECQREENRGFVQEGETCSGESSFSLASSSAWFETVMIYFFFLVPMQRAYPVVAFLTWVFLFRCCICDFLNKMSSPLLIFFRWRSVGIEDFIPYIFRAYFVFGYRFHSSEIVFWYLFLFGCFVSFFFEQNLLSALRVFRRWMIGKEFFLLQGYKMKRRICCLDGTFKVYEFIAGHLVFVPPLFSMQVWSCCTEMVPFLSDGFFHALVNSRVEEKCSFYIFWSNKIVRPHRITSFHISWIWNRFKLLVESRSWYNWRLFFFRFR